MAVRKVLQSFAPKLAGLGVQWHTDNQNIVGIGWPEVSGWPSGCQWVAYAESFRVICFSQWVTCTLPEGG